MITVGILIVLVTLLLVWMWRKLLRDQRLARRTILRLLRDGPDSGLNLVKRSDGALSRGTVYVYLAGLVQHGHLTVRSEPTDPDGPRGDRARNIYKLAPTDPQ